MKCSLARPAVSNTFCASSALGRVAIKMTENSRVCLPCLSLLQFKEPAADLAMAVAIASSYLDTPVPPRLAVMGEVDLAGLLRNVGNLEQRLAEVAQLGHCDVCIVPKVGHFTRVEHTRVEHSRGCYNF